MAEYADFFADDDDDLELMQTALLEDEGNAPGVLHAVAEILDEANLEARNAVPNYVKNVVPQYSDVEFISHFRVKSTLAADLARQFGDSPFFQTSLGHGGTEPVAPYKQMLAYLWFVGHEAASFRDVADRFHVSLGTLHSIITRVTEFLLSLAPQVIKLPSPEEKQATQDFFHRSKGFPGVIGAIDGCHIRIDTPTVDQNSYVNRKKYFSVILQGVANERRKFMDVFVGFLGSVHDARVFRNSSFKNKLPELCEGGTYILGDSAYPCTRHLIVPYRDNGHLTRARHGFNSALSSCRVVIEHTFGILKQRFRQLYHLKLRNMARMVQVIHACCVLHNLADEDDLENFEPPIDDQRPDPDAAACAVADRNGDRHDDSAAGKDLRDEICRQLATQRGQ